MPSDPSEPTPAPKPSPTVKRGELWLKGAIGLVASVLLLWWLFRGEDLGEVGRQLAAADLWLLLASAAMITAGAAIRAARWQLLLRPVMPSPRLYPCWQAIIIGFTATNLLPARLGELVRPWALSRIAPVSTSAALGTVVLERILDTIALLVLLIATLLSPAFPSGAMVMGRSIGSAVIATATIASIALAGVVLLLSRPTWTMATARFVTSWLPRRLGDAIVGVLESFLDGFRLLRSPRSLLIAMLWSLGVWMWMAASFLVAFAAFGIDLGTTAATFTTCAVCLFVALPAAPGFLGTLHAGIAVSVHDIFGAPADSALSLAVGYHLAGFLPVTALGLWYAWRLGLRPSHSLAQSGTQPTGL